MPFERQPSVLAFFVGTPLVGQERLGEFIQKDIQGGVGFGAFCDHALIANEQQVAPRIEGFDRSLRKAHLLATQHAGTLHGQIIADDGARELKLLAQDLLEPHA